MKKFIILAVIICAVLLIAACSGGKDKDAKVPGVTTFTNDMESTGWINQYTLSKEIAHSGKFSSRIDSIMQYSFGFSEFFKNISDTLPEQVNIDLWLLYPQTGINSTLVVSIDSIGKSIFWTGQELKDSVKTANQWKEVKTSFTLPVNIMPTDKISIYVWNKDKKAFYIDDMKVSFGKKK